MEHRCSVRKPFDFQLLIYKHGLPVQSGVCRDLGLGGMFVATTGYQWRKNEYLEVEFFGVDGEPRMRLPAVVVHHGEQGAGLMFDAITNEQRRCLRVWLFKKPTQTSSASPTVGRTTQEVA